MKGEYLDNVEGDVYDSKMLISDNDYYTLQNKEDYRQYHSTFIPWFQVWCGFWILFNLLFTIASISFGIYIITAITGPLMLWHYFMGFSFAWRRVYLKLKFKLWYIEREFAERMYRNISVRQRMADWGKSHVQRYEEERDERRQKKNISKEEPRAPKPKRKGFFSRFKKPPKSIQERGKDIIEDNINSGRGFNSESIEGNRPVSDGGNITNDSERDRRGPPSGEDYI